MLDAVNLSQVCFAYEWYRAFKSGRDVMKDLPRSRRLSTQRCKIHGAKLWNWHLKIMVHYATCLQDACSARN